jgi:hypothetical protein
VLADASFARFERPFGLIVIANQEAEIQRLQVF